MSLPTATRRLEIDTWRQELRHPASALQQLADRIDRQEPRIHALVEEAGRFARLERETESSASGPLHGVPIGFKDIIHIDGLPTRAGSRLPVAELEGPEASAVRALRAAGGVILGKTVCTEFAYFVPGPTRNPHNPEHTPGGSSSGSAAAVAAGYCPLALGTQTIGSISRPAAFCGVVGFKPTFGRIDLDGVIPLSPSLDHLGVFSSSVDDAAVAAAILCRDWTSTLGDRRPVLGIPAGPYLERASPAGREHFRQVCAVLSDSGWNTETVEILDDFPVIEQRHQVILAAEVARVHAHWFRRFGDLYHPRTRELIERGRKISDGELAQALAAKDALRERLATETKHAGIDLWISPAAPGPAPRGLASTGDPVMNLPWTQVGVPTLSLPAGRDSATGLPLGLQVAGTWNADEDLMGWCKELARSLEAMS